MKKDDKCYDTLSATLDRFYEAIGKLKDEYIKTLKSIFGKGK